MELKGEMSVRRVDFAVSGGAPSKNSLCTAHVESPRLGLGLWEVADSSVVPQSGERLAYTMDIGRIVTRDCLSEVRSRLHVGPIRLLWQCWLEVLTATVSVARDALAPECSEALAQPRSQAASLRERAARRGSPRRIARITSGSPRRWGRGRGPLGRRPPPPPGSCCAHGQLMDTMAEGLADVPHTVALPLLPCSRCTRQVWRSGARLCI